MSQPCETCDDRQPIWEKRWTERSADTVVRKKEKTKETSARGPQRWPQRAISLWELTLTLSRIKNKIIKDPDKFTTVF